MKVLPCGDRAVLLDCETLSEAQSWFEALKPDLDVVLGAKTVLVPGEPRYLRRLVSATTPASLATIEPTESVAIPVVYDGADLAEVAGLTGMSISEVIAAHSGTTWTVAFGGFAPGFFYLVDGDPRLKVARRSTPRTHVPAGAVGLAGEFSGVYPRESPGGWQIIGRTTTQLWDVTRDPPALLSPGQVVQFVVA